MTVKYTEDHEWVTLDADIATVGITMHAQDALGDVVFVELPAVGVDYAQKETAGVVESVKAASDLYAPVAGTVVAVNAALESAPETVNRAPYAEGWMLRLKPADAAAASALLDAMAYAKLVG